MSPEEKQLVHFLSDMLSVEQQALAQLVTAPDLAEDARMASDLRQHHRETEQHAVLVGGRLEAHGGSVSAIKSAIMKLGGKGFLLFAASQPETPGRLAAHAYSYEAMEWAGYEMLIRFAEAAGDSQTVETARKIRDEEREMMERLEGDFDGAEQASHLKTPPEDMAEHVRKHVAEAHALEHQGIALLVKAKDIAGDPQLSAVCARHLEASRSHERLLEKRLDALGSGCSVLKDTLLAAGGLNWGLFFQAQSDTPAKLAAFAYAYEHLKIGGYELLKRTARRAGDAETQRLCEDLLTKERAMVKSIAEAFDSAAKATLAGVEP